MKTPSKETVAHLREDYPEGTRVELISMDDPYSTLMPGDRGSVSLVDDTGTIFVDWDRGSHLGAVYGEDRVKRIENEIRYETGADFWRDMATQHGRQDALGICGRYLKAQLKTQDDEEKRFCRELFDAAIKDAARQTDPEKIIYPYPLEKAGERLEESYYHDSRILNNQCALLIDTAIRQSCYRRDFYNLGIAAMVAIHDCGFERVRAVLSHNIMSRKYDGRFSHTNREYVSDFDLPAEAFSDAILNSHPILIDGFANHFRKMYGELDAAWLTLPGEPEAGCVVKGYEVVRSIWFDDRRGFAVAHDPDAVSPYVCWQFSAEGKARDFYWGTYCATERGAQANYTTRTLIHMKDETVKEIPNPLSAAEMSVEQNLNMIDGMINNEKPRPVRADEHTPFEDRPSALAQIREARAKVPEPRKQKDEHRRDEGGLEL
jgi:hypothetical protein